MRITFAIVALLLICSQAFRIKQDAQADLTASASDAQAGMGAATQGLQDLTTGLNDAASAFLSQFQNLLTTFGGAMGGGAAPASRLQQATFNDAVQDGQQVLVDVTTSVEDYLNSLNEVGESVVDTADTALENLGEDFGPQTAAPAARR